MPLLELRVYPLVLMCCKHEVSDHLKSPLKVITLALHKSESTSELFVFRCLHGIVKPVCARGRFQSKSGFFPPCWLLSKLFCYAVFTPVLVFCMTSVGAYIYLCVVYSDLYTSEPLHDTCMQSKAIMIILALDSRFRLFLQGLR